MKPRERKSRRRDELAPLHRPKRACFHVAQEVRELGEPERAEQLVRGLLPWARKNALGL